MILNILLTIVCLMLIAYYYSFELPKKDKKLFKLYLLHDKVTGQIANESELAQKDEYKFVLELLNQEVKFINEGIKISSLGNRIDENDESLDVLLQNIKDDKFLSEIFNESRDIFTDHIKYRVKLFCFFILKPAIWILSLCNVILEKRNLNKKERKQKKRKLYMYRDYVYELPNIFNYYSKCI